MNRRPGSLATGLLVLAGLGLAGLWAAFHLQLDPRALWPGTGGWRLAGDFFGAAVRPAFTFQEKSVSMGPWDVPWQALKAAGMTVVFAATSLSLAVIGGGLLGMAGSTAWWDAQGSRSRWGFWITAASRLLMTLMRSIHELVWAVLLLAALGSGHLVAVLAIAIPYTGTLAKVFSEMIDEAPRPAFQALRGSGAGPGQAYLLGLVPAALPDMLGYTFYRFECALRSSAVLGFFGFPTLGYHIAASFENLHYGEVWTYLYVLFALILTVDWWSGRLRQELTS